MLFVITYTSILFMCMWIVGINWTRVYDSMKNLKIKLECLIRSLGIPQKQYGVQAKSVNYWYAYGLKTIYGKRKTPDCSQLE